MAAAFAGPDLVVTHHSRPIPGGLYLDVTDAPGTAALISEVRPQVVILAAAEAYVERCEREPEATRAINADAARTIADVAGAQDALLVVFSSEYVFDGTKGRYREDEEVHPINEYGRQKAELEAIVRTLPRHLICRTSGVFGWEQGRRNFVCRLIDSLRMGREFAVPSDQLITPTYAADLARALTALVARGTTGTLNLVGPSILPRTSLAAKVCDVFGLPAELIVPRATADLGLAAARPSRAGLADDELRRILGAPLQQPSSALREMRRAEVPPLTPSAG